MNLTAALSGSRLLWPLFALSTLPSGRIEDWRRASGLGGLLDRLIRPLGDIQGLKQANIGHGGLLLIGVAALFVGASFLGTGQIAILLAAVFGWTMLTVLWSRRLDVLHRLTVIDLLVILFFLSSAVSAAFSSYTQASLIGFAKFFLYFCGYVSFRTLTHQRPSATVYLLVLLTLLGGFEALVGLYQYQSGVDPLATWSDPTVNPEDQLMRVYGTLKPYNPNLYAGYMIPCLAAALGVSLLGLRTKRFRGFGLLSALFAAVIAICLILSGSRGGYLALALMGAGWFFYLGHLIWNDALWQASRWMKRTWAATLIIVVLGFSLAVATVKPLQQRVASIFAMREDSSISYRLNVYQSATRMFLDNPVVGIGPGNNTFKLAYGIYMVPGYNALGAYSVPLEVAVEQGVIGLTLFLLLYGVIFTRTALVVDAPTASLAQKIVVGCLAVGLVGFLAHGLFDTVWYRPSVNLLFWFFLAAFAERTEAVLHPPIQVLPLTESLLASAGQPVSKSSFSSEWAPSSYNREIYEDR
jgi:putative inorganic carbon (HCO3(-)) transporter